MDFNDFRKQRYQGSSRHHAVPKGGCPTIIAFQQVLERGFRTSINIPMRKVTIPDHTIGGGAPKIWSRRLDVEWSLRRTQKIS
jgi:hypothetical protein